MSRMSLTFKCPRIAPGGERRYFTFWSPSNPQDWNRNRGGSQMLGNLHVKRTSLNCDPNYHLVGPADVMESWLSAPSRIVTPLPAAWFAVFLNTTVESPPPRDQWFRSSDPGWWFPPHAGWRPPPSLSRWCPLPPHPPECPQPALHPLAWNVSPPPLLSSSALGCLFASSQCAGGKCPAIFIFVFWRGLSVFAHISHTVHVTVLHPVAS